MAPTPSTKVLGVLCGVGYACFFGSGMGVFQWVESGFEPFGTRDQVATVVAGLVFGVLMGTWSYFQIQRWHDSGLAEVELGPDDLRQARRAATTGPKPVDPAVARHALDLARFRLGGHESTRARVGRVALGVLAVAFLAFGLLARAWIAVGGAAIATVLLAVLLWEMVRLRRQLPVLQAER